MSETIKCIIVDDEPLASDVIKDYIEKVPQLELIAICANAFEALQALSTHSVDLLFLDIEMPEMNGIDFLKSLSHAPSVILTTAYRDYAMESYEVDVVDYLLKPISFNRFFKSITKYLKIATSTNSSVDNVTKDAALSAETSSGFMYVYAEKKNIKVYFDDIVYVESLKDYVRVHTRERNIISKSTIAKYEDMLPNIFLRIHRSFIVNTTKVTAYTNHDIEIEQKEFPIGSSYKKAVLEQLKD